MERVSQLLRDRVISAPWFNVMNMTLNSSKVVDNCQQQTFKSSQMYFLV